MKRIARLLLTAVAGGALLQPGCFTPSDFAAITEGQFIAYINALISSVTSDLIRGALGG
jgi:hypothetical protein